MIQVEKLKCDSCHEYFIEETAVFGFKNKLFCWHCFRAESYRYYKILYYGENKLECVMEKDKTNHRAWKKIPYWQKLKKN